MENMSLNMTLNIALFYGRKENRYWFLNRITLEVNFVKNHDFYLRDLILIAVNWNWCDS